MSELVFQHWPLSVDEIPVGWELVALSAFVTDIQTGFPSGDHNSDGHGVPHLRPMNVTPDGTIDLTDLRSVAPEANTLRLRRGDVLFNNTNSPVWVGKTAHVDTDIEMAYSNHMTRVRVPEEIDARYLAKQIHFLCTTGYFQFQCKKHVNQASINRSFLAESTPFLLPPSNEQRRITTKIDALQERSRKAREALAEVGPLLEQFRQSLLAAAFRGDLTADWRAANPNVEPASELLNRIRQERRQKWEQSELAKYESKAKQPPKDWQDKYVETSTLSESELTNLPDIPDNWVWSAVEELVEPGIEIVYGIVQPGPNLDEGVP
jgi:type I restriction enzyme S subunit